MPRPSKDPEHLSIRLLCLLEASASGRYPITCVFVIALLVLIGMAVGWL